jgi:hypothetical protein
MFCLNLGNGRRDGALLRLKHFLGYERKEESDRGGVRQESGGQSRFQERAQPALDQLSMLKQALWRLAAKNQDFRMTMRGFAALAGMLKQMNAGR